MSSSSLPPSQESISFCVDPLHPWTSLNYPFLSYLKSCAPDVSSRLVNRKDGAPNPSSLSALTILFSLGLYPKNVMEAVYDDFVAIDKLPFNDLSWSFRRSRVSYLTVDYDNQKNIFERHTVWYYFPSLCSLIKTSPHFVSRPSHKNWIELDFILNPISPYDPLPWLTGLLYEFGFACNILTSPTLCYSNVKEVQIFLAIHRSQRKGFIHIYWPHDNDDCLRRSVVKAKCIEEVLLSSPPLSDMVSSVVISSKDGLIDVDDASEKAVDFWNEQHRLNREKRLNSNVTGSSQNLSCDRVNLSDDSIRCPLNSVFFQLMKVLIIYKS